MTSIRPLLLAVLIVPIFSTTIIAQHNLTLENGNILTGKIKVLYSDQYLNDYVSFTGSDGKEQKFNADEIASFSIDYKSFEPMVVQYYVFAKKAEVERTILASNILEGELSLWKYEGFGFSFVLQRFNEYYPLQKGSTTRGLGDNYKTVFITLAGDYYSIKEVSKFKYSTKSFLRIVNEYNSNKNRYYVPKKSSIKYLRKLNIGGSLGSTIVTNDFSFLHYYYH